MNKGQKITTEDLRWLTEVLEVEHRCPEPRSIKFKKEFNGSFNTLKHIWQLIKSKPALL